MTNKFFAREPFDLLHGSGHEEFEQMFLSEHSRRRGTFECQTSFMEVGGWLMSSGWPIPSPNFRSIQASHLDVDSSDGRKLEAWNPTS